MSDETVEETGNMCYKAATLPSSGIVLFEGGLRNVYWEIQYSVSTQN